MSAVAAGGLLGCGGPTGQFYVVQNQVPTAGCVIPADKGGQYRGEGVLDLRIPNASSEGAYFLFPLLQNDLPPSEEVGVEPNRISMTGFEVDIVVTDGPAAAHDLFASLEADPATNALVRFQSPWSGSVAPGGGNLAAAVTAIPSETAGRLRDAAVLSDGSEVRVAAKVRAVGYKLGVKIRSDVFTYPVRICDGCLINSVTHCPAVGTTLPGSACNVSQDSPVDCCTNGSDLVCPAMSAP